MRNQTPTLTFVAPALSEPLVLLNGRRTTGSPSLGGGGIVNLNMLPKETIDRIEIIPDGASAIYGSDAVAGVINVIMKDEYEGFKLKTRYGTRSRDGGEEIGVSLLTGASTDRGSFVAGFEHDSRDAILMQIAHLLRHAKKTRTATV